MRAIEEGLPLVRAANTGVSVIVDPLGRVIRSLPLGAEAVLDGPLPRRIDPPFYGRVGDALIGVILGIVAIVITACRKFGNRLN